MSRTTTTHTVDMAQIAELNTLLSTNTGSAVSAAELGLEGVTVNGPSADTLAGSAVLARICWDGAPEFPDIHGHFSASAGTEGAIVVDLHTAALREISHRLHARHAWGQGSIFTQR